MEYEPRVKRPSYFEKFNDLSPKEKVYYAQLGLYVSCVAVDTLTTLVSLSSGSGREGNSVASYLLDRFGVGGWLLARGSLFIAGAGFFELARHMESRWLGKYGDKMLSAANLALRGTTVLFTAVCVNNAAVFLLNK